MAQPKYKVIARKSGGKGWVEMGVGWDDERNGEGCFNFYIDSIPVGWDGKMYIRPFTTRDEKERTKEVYAPQPSGSPPAKPAYDFDDEIPF